ncbi:hypothetical protein [Curtobacterium ammoniigenes]|uniref:hypothetical protein n=1 Tax=Curtobacterium ammoniigenes TaxID=395387 RepID=UPI000AFCA246|nr:hypothetical protein [Curtobacterium ammoniigenes]
MLTVLALVAVAVLVTIAAPVVLTVGGWRIRHPRIALNAWIAALVVALTALGLSVVVAATIVATTAGAHPMDQPGSAVRPDGPGLGATAATLFVWGALASLGGITALLLVRAEPIGQARDRSESAITLLAARAAYRTDRIGNDAVVFVETGQPIACSTADGRILISRPIEAAMPALWVRAIIEHERAHVRRHHEFVMRVAALNEAAFPFLGSARAFRRTVRLLVELVADDDAARVVGPATVCNALAAMEALEPDQGLALRAERIARLPVRARTDIGRLAPIVTRRHH